MLEGSKELPGKGSSFCATGKSKIKHNGIVLVARPDQQREQPAVVDWGEAIGRVTILAIIIFFWNCTFLDFLLFLTNTRTHLDLFLELLCIVV